MSKKKNEEHYVNNKEFFEEMKEYIYNKRQNSELRVPDCIGLKIMKICTKLSYRPNFINYTYREEMVGDAIENCIAYIDNFDPDKSNNPFSYFTRIAWFAYLRRIAKEKKTTKLKAKYVQNLADMHELFDHVMMSGQDHDDISDVYEHITETVQKYYNYEFEEEPEKKERKTRAKKTAESKVEDFT